jgi:hypothetical protein
MEIKTTNMKNTENTKSFEQMAKDAESKKRMQELAGIDVVKEEGRPAGDILQDMITEIKKIRDVVSAELIKRKEVK